MDLPALRAVVAVGEELHFGRAAERMGVAQPQVSQRVRKLEDELGVEIFERSHHRVRLTEAGQPVVALAAEIVAGARRLERLGNGLRQGTQGTVVLGVVGSAFFGPLARVLAPCRSQLPDVRIQVRELESPLQITALRQGDIDLGLLRPPAVSGIDSTTVWSEPLVVAVHVSNPLAERRQVSMADLAGEEVVLFARESGPGYWDRVAGMFDRAGRALAPVAEADHVTTLLGLVSLGAGITFVPESASAIASPHVRYLRLADAPLLELALVWHTGQLAPATRQVVDTITETATGSGHP